MMEKAIKQRLLGGLVLVAGAVLFLPVLFDGSGAGLTIPPLPAAPEVASVEAMAPQLEQKVVEADQAIDAAHAGREDADAAPAVEGDVAPDAAAQAAGEGAPVAATAAAATATATVTAAAAARAPAPAPAARPVPPSVPTLAKPASPAPVPAASPKLSAPVPAKPVAAAPVPAKPVAPAAVAKLAPVVPRPVTKPASAAVPGAWVVQVASLSSREQAQKLVQQLRGKGYPAVLNPQGDKWKVMVGPELNRAVADSIKNRLAADPELRLNGWVQAYKP